MPDQHQPRDSQFAGERELIVIAAAGAGLRAAPDRTGATGADADPLPDRLAAAGATMAPLFGATADRARTAPATTAAGDDLADLGRLHRVTAADDVLDDLAARLRELDAVTTAY